MTVGYASIGQSNICEPATCGRCRHGKQQRHPVGVFHAEAHRSPERCQRDDGSQKLENAAPGIGRGITGGDARSCCSRRSVPYYEPLRPCAPHRYSDPRGFSRLDPSLGIGTTGSHVPYKSPVQARATSMPVAIWAVNRLPPDSSQRTKRTLVLTTSLYFRHLHDGSLAFAFLDHTCRVDHDFSSTAHHNGS